MAKTVSTSSSPARGIDELEALHATLDSRLAALEAALANPDDCALEGLILDLARAATEEAEAAARHASAHAREEADKQAGSAFSQIQVAEAALSSERQASLELHRSLGAARSELEAAKQKLSVLTAEIEQMRDAFTIERTTLRNELSEAERCFAAADTLRQQAESARGEEVARERATSQKLTDALAQVRSELDAARQDVASRAADMEAARERADAAARTHSDLTQSVNEARARLDAVIGERDRLKADLEASQQGAAASAAALRAADAERAATEQKWRDAEARVQAAERERDDLFAERDELRTQLDAARQSSATAAAALQAVDGQRLAVEQSLRDVETRAQAVVRERDAAIAELDAARAKHDAVIAERDAAHARGQAAEAERDALAAQLEDNRHTAAMAKAAIQSLDGQRATLDRDLQESEARADAVARERDAAIADRNAAVAERDALVSERNAAVAARDEVMSERDAVMSERDAVMSERDEVMSERDAAVAQHAAASADVEALRKTINDAQSRERARFTELRQRTERQIRELEEQLLGSPVEAASVEAAIEEDGQEIDVPLDDIDGDDVNVIEIDAPMAARPKVAAVSRSAQGATPPAGQQPVRAASRHAFREPLEIKLEGESAQLVDISTAGAQVLSKSALKPNKPVKVLLPSSEAIVLCKARIVWSRLEPPTPGKPLRYRAGMAFTQADAAALQLFITRHTGVKMQPTPTPAEERKTGRLIPVPFPNATRTEDAPRRNSREPIASIDFNFPAGRE